MSWIWLPEFQDLDNPNISGGDPRMGEVHRLMDNQNRGALGTYSMGRYDIVHSLERIKGDYGVTARVKPKILKKYGRSDQIDNNTYTTIMELPSGTLNEIYLDHNGITSVTCKDGDVGKPVSIEGHYFDTNYDLIFHVQTIILAGTSAPLTQNLARATRMVVKGSTAAVADIYCIQGSNVANGVAVTGTSVHNMIKGSINHNQSQKCATTTSYRDYWLLTKQFSSVLSKTGSPVIEYQLEIKEARSDVWRIQSQSGGGIAGGVHTTQIFDPHIIIPPNHDVRIQALASASGVDASAYINGYLAIDQAKKNDSEWTPL